MGTRIDWRTLDTTTAEGRRALDVEIARRLGKKVFTALNESERQFDQNREWVSEFYVEDGRIYEVSYYTSDLNTAMQLPTPPEHIAAVLIQKHTLAVNEQERWHVYIHDMRGQQFDAWNASLALALCLAWLAWHDAKTAHDKLSSDT